MEIDKEKNEYIDKLRNRKFEVNGLLVELGTLGVLFHPFKMIRLKKEMKKIGEINRDITKMSSELANARYSVFHTEGFQYNGAVFREEYLSMAIKKYIDSHPIDESGVVLQKNNKSKVLSLH